MARSGVIRLRALINGALSILLATTMAGCTVPSVDNIRPEINKMEGMLLDPSVAGFIDDVNKSGSVYADGDILSESVIIGGAGDPASPEEEEEPTTAAVQYDYVDPSSYAHYLFEHFEETVSLLSGDIYFRVFHFGYECIPTASGTLVGNAAVAEMSYSGNPTANPNNFVYGSTMSDFAIQWLRTVSVNLGVIPMNRNWVQSQLDSIAVADEALPLDAPDLVEKVRAMWTFNECTFAEYRDLVNSDEVLGVLPNVGLSVPEGYNNYPVTANEWTEGMPFVHKMNTASLNNMMRNHNTYDDRVVVSALLYQESDDHSATFGYVDGYNRTIIVLGTTNGETLETVLGENYETVLSAMQSVYACTNVTNISDVLEGIGEDADVVYEGSMEG